MKIQTLRLSRPVYEGLPWLYVLAGLIALAVSYGQDSTALSLVIGLPGLIALLAGLVVLLKRRDYRAMRAHYERPDALAQMFRED
jgi:LPXTG-motif cell wall-anchored protein